jgi:hypothetical protein
MVLTIVMCLPAILDFLGHCSTSSPLISLLCSVHLSNLPCAVLVMTPSMYWFHPVRCCSSVMEVSNIFRISKVRTLLVLHTYFLFDTVFWRWRGCKPGPGLRTNRTITYISRLLLFTTLSVVLRASRCSSSNHTMVLLTQV